MSAGATSQDLYEILNVGKDASDADITAAYKRLRYYYHPDKHVDDNLKDTARAKFQNVQEAYEILSNQDKRLKYDLFGMEGVRASFGDKQVGVPSKSVEAMKRDWERQQAEARQRELEAKLSVHTEMRAGLDLSRCFQARRKKYQIRNADLASILGGRRKVSLFPAPDSEVHKDELPFQPLIDRVLLADMGAVSVTQGFLQTLSKGRMIEFNASAYSAKGQSIARAETTWRSPMWDSLSTVEATLSLASRTQLNQIAIRSTRQLTPFLNAQVAVGTSLSRVGLPAFFQVMVRTQLSAQSVGQVTWDFGGTDPGVSSAYSRSFFDKLTSDEEEDFAQQSQEYAGRNPPQRPSFGYHGRVHLGARTGFSISAGATRVRNHFVWKTNVRCEPLRNLPANMMGVGLQWGAHVSRSFGDHNRFGVGFSIGIFDGMSWILRFERAGQKIVIPITLCAVFDPLGAIANIAALALLSYGAYRFLLKPKDDESVRERKQAREKEKAEKVVRDRERAETEQLLLRAMVERKRSEEENRKGLVIVNAQYGVFAESDNDEEHVVDVTVPLQALVEQSRLLVASSVPKARLDGFYDPAPGKPKKLRIVYRFKDALHSADIAEDDAIAVPMPAHRRS